MRKTSKDNGVSLKAYAGTTGVLLATDIDNKKRKGLLGYAVERKVGSGKKEWLQALLRFPNGAPGEAGKPIDTNLAPVQKFRWSDYRVLPDKEYEYTVHPVYGEPGNLDVEAGPTVKVKAASNLKGEHCIVFNRAAAASQAFSRNFPEVDKMMDQWRKDRKKDKKLPELRLPANVLTWLTRGVLEQIIGFIERAKDETWALDVAIYEYELEEIVNAVKAAADDRKADVRVVYHAKNGDPQTEENEHSLEGFPKEKLRGRLTSKIFHNKFIVLSKLVDGKREPQTVLCGSTNFTHNGVYRQGNVVHVLDRVDAAQQYLTLFELFFRGDTTAQTRKFITEQNQMDDAKPIFVGFSPRTGLGDLQAIARAIGSAKRDVLFCTAFDLNDDIEAALLGQPKDPILRYGVQNTRSAITGFHADRTADFSATAMLSKGLEGFLKESTKGQRGNILIHTKLVVVDFTSDNPIVISGSHNLSKSASDGNDENYLIIRGNTDVADSFGCELMRMYDHYRFRFISQSKLKSGQKQKPLFLTPDDSWTDSYFNPKSLKMNDRLRFAGK